MTRIARAVADDLAGLLAVDVALVVRDRQEAIVREAVASGTCLVAFVDGVAAGYLTWDLGFFHRPFVRLLAIASAYRRGGLGAALLARAEAEIAERGLGELFVSTEAINAPMQALLARAGYAPSGAIDNVNEPGNHELVYYRRL